MPRNSRPNGFAGARNDMPRDGILFRMLTLFDGLGFINQHDRNIVFDLIEKLTLVTY
jgi:hypothetical protein